MTRQLKRIAFIGYARTGKDTAAQCLIDRGYTRRAFGDYIKRQLDPLCMEHFGYKASEVSGAEKEWLRPLLEIWGDVNYDRIAAEYFRDLPELCVNTRLVRPPEGNRWIKEGGVLVWIEKPGVEACSDWEHLAMESLLHTCPVHATILNDGSVEQLWGRVLEVAGLAGVAPSVPAVAAPPTPPPQPEPMQPS